MADSTARCVFFRMRPLDSFSSGDIPLIKKVQFNIKLAINWFWIENELVLELAEIIV